MLNPAYTGSPGTILKAIQADPRETAAYFLVGVFCTQADVEIDVSHFTRDPELIAKVKSHRTTFRQVRFKAFYANSSAALALTSKGRGREEPRLALRLSKENGRWLVPDVQIEKKGEYGEALQNFLKEYPDARAVQMDLATNIASERNRSGQDGPPSVPSLIRKLKTEDLSHLRANAAAALGDFGLNARSAIPDLILALRDEDEFVRASAAEAIGEIDPTDLRAVPALIEAMKDKSSRVRVVAAQTLLKIGPVNKNVILAFIEASDDNWKGVINACN